MKYSKIKFLTFFAIICSTGLTPINDAFAATTFVDAKDVSTEDTSVSGLAFNNDGTKMFVIGLVSKDVHEYTCAAFDVSTCNVVVGGQKDVSVEDTAPQDLAFNNDGTKMFVVGSTNDNVYEYTCAAFDVSTCNVVVGGQKDVSAQENFPQGLAFNNDGTKMFLTGDDGDNVYEYTCAAFDVSTCSFVDAFDVSAQQTGPAGLDFNSDGTKMFVIDFNGADNVSEYTLSVGFDLNVPVAETETTTTSSDCYDCKPPVLQSSHITILTNDYVVATGDDLIHITANVGDKVTILLNVTDNKFVDTIPFAALYTNYQEKPSDMNLFYANNFDKWKHVSTSFYEWNVRADDVAYDYDGTTTWSDNTPTVVTGEITDDNYFMINDNNVLEYFMMPFTFTMSNSMDESTITAKIYDAAGNRLHVTLPVTLETAGNDPLDFDHMGKQKVLGFFNESVLNTMILELNGSEDAAPLSAFLGIPDESLPAWTLDLATWVADEKIDSADMIVAVEYLINN